MQKFLNDVRSLSFLLKMTREKWISFFRCLFVLFQVNCSKKICNLFLIFNLFPFFSKYLCFYIFLSFLDPNFLSSKTEYFFYMLSSTNLLQKRHRDYCNWYYMFVLWFSLNLCRRSKFHQEYASSELLKYLPTLIINSLCCFLLNKTKK